MQCADINVDGNALCNHHDKSAIAMYSLLNYIIASFFITIVCAGPAMAESL